MASLESLLKVHSKRTSYFGSSFNPAPERDALGRRPASPLEVIKAINGEFNLPKQAVIYRKGRRS